MSSLINVNSLKQLRNNFKSNQITFLICDIQDKYIDKCYLSENLIKSAVLLSKIVSILNIQTIIAEHVPKVFGKTPKEIINQLTNPILIEKKSFSMLNDDYINTNFPSDHSFILIGIETQICVFQTAFKLIENKKNVFVVKDAVSSISEHERESGLRLLNEIGVGLMSIQSLITFLIEDSSDERFKKIVPIIKELNEVNNKLI